jgi:hypothetical protein
MKRTFITLICILALIAGSISVASAEHFLNGSAGVKVASMPQKPGFYYKFYGVYATADKQKDGDGKDLMVSPAPGLPAFKADIDATVTGMAHRFIYITDWKIPGSGSLGFNFVVPVLKKGLDFSLLTPGAPTPVFDDDTSGVGDITLNSTATWRMGRYDIGSGIGLFVPTGKYDSGGKAKSFEDLTSPGQDHYTLMLSLGGTYYFDEAKTWHISTLTRYEIHSENDELDITYGDDYHLEWGIGKTLMRIIDVGVAGYAQWQITDDSGSAVTWDKSVHDRVYAIGLEAKMFYPPWMAFFELRALKEFDAVDRLEGERYFFSAGKKF